MSDPLKLKLENYEAAPPPGVWENIVPELKETNELKVFSTKLFDFETAPPPGAWLTISKNLSDGELFESEQKVIKPLEILPSDGYHNTPVKSMRGIYKMAIAAAIIGIIAVSSFFLFNNDDRQGVVSGPGERNGRTINSVMPSDKPIYNPDKLSAREPDIAASVGIPTTVRSPLSARFLLAASTPSQSNKRTKHTAYITDMIPTSPVNDMYFLPEQASISVPAKPIRNESGTLISDNALLKNGDDDYVSVTAPNGDQTRISIKFLSALPYLNKDMESEDYYAESEEMGGNWKVKFQDWRNKILSTSFVPATANFLDILEMRDMIIKNR